MNPQQETAAQTGELRSRAEARLQSRPPRTYPPRSTVDTQRLIHELQVHQVELEMQNEELRAVRDSLEQGLEKYGDLYDFAPVGYLTLDREGIIQEANLTAASLLAIERFRLLKRPFSQHLTAADQPVFRNLLERVFSSRVRESCDVILRRDGKPLVEVRIEALATDAQHTCRAVLMDVTGRKQAEMDRLIVSKLESTGILAGGIAHDFNNLLAVIVLSLELAQAHIPAEAASAARVAQAMQAAMLARDLTGRLISLAPEAGMPNRQPTALHAIIRESIGAALKGSRLRCAWSLAEDLWPVAVDERQFGLVIENLALNARDAMPDGGTLTVQAVNAVLSAHGHASLAPGDYVRISIADQGPGIAKEVLPMIFDPYFSTKSRGVQKGMGLGLTICHAVIKNHGGAIDVTSQPGVGATVHLHLPACRAASVEQP
jgi:PAS domain S-box-containing protein